MATSSSRPRKTSLTNPVEIASSAGARSSSWHKLGDAPWEGTVVYADAAGELKELEIQEMASSWKATDETGSSRTARTLEQLLQAELKTGLKKTTRKKT